MFDSDLFASGFSSFPLTPNISFSHLEREVATILQNVAFKSTSSSCITMF